MTFSGPPFRPVRTMTEPVDSQLVYKTSNHNGLGQLGETIMNLGSIVRRAVSAFASSKRRPATRRPVRPTTTTRRHGGSAESDLVRGVAKMAKKKL
ncbi:hypothetical protein FP2506_03735 [Fulvimarina pelagi HTCC2506]|uniref:Uncharacterized protein n=1 Tax=Fulvimarina pelagi HTCC2506 TaxID=314231 RepID=Q0FZH1_9HYPH|nr:hypothetical protein FP2506_03735 [Fulvimarina pelagi HTCC2506]